MSSAETRSERLTALRGALAGSGLDLAALAPTDNMRYALGFTPHPDERACFLLLTRESELLLVPSLNAEEAAADAPELTHVTWSDDAGADGALADALLRLAAGDARRVSVDPEMRADHLLLLQQQLGDARFESATAIIGPLRSVKSAAEIATLAAAARVADDAMRAGFAACRVGARELDVAEAIVAAFGAGGSDAKFTIVASGPNGAFPHYMAGERRLQDGDAVVIDIGGRKDGYVSDITRMVVLGSASERYLEVHGIVERAVQAGLAAARPGARCEEVDAAARDVIEEAGYGPYFVHRTGHGLGLSVHEPPWIMRGSEVVLEPGMVHSVEPGIYLPGEFGVRLEEIVHITDDGCERFSALPRDAYVSAA